MFLAVALAGMLARGGNGTADELHAGGRRGTGTERIGEGTALATRSDLLELRAALALLGTLHLPALLVLLGGLTSYFST